MKSYFYKIYHNSLIPIRIRNYFWYLFRRANLDLTWFNEFNNYWANIIGRKKLLSVQDLFFLKNLFRIKFLNNQVPDTDDPFIHLEAWQRPELIYQLIHLACKESVSNQYTILNLLRKKKRKFRSLLEYGCATAPITTSLFEFFKIPKNKKIYISDIQTLAFHFAAFKFRKYLNVIPILLTPDNNFLLKLNEKVDIIFCIAVFEHLNNPLKVIKTFHKNINYDGLLFFDYKKSTGGGMDTLRGAKERNNVLDFVNKNFEVVFGRTTKEKSMGITILRKH